MKQGIKQNCKLSFLCVLKISKQHPRKLIDCNFKQTIDDERRWKGSHEKDNHRKHEGIKWFFKQLLWEVATREEQEKSFALASTLGGSWLGFEWTWSHFERFWMSFVCFKRLHQHDVTKILQKRSCPNEAILIPSKTNSMKLLSIALFTSRAFAVLFAFFMNKITHLITFLCVLVSFNANARGDAIKKCCFFARCLLCSLLSTSFRYNFSPKMWDDFKNIYMKSSFSGRTCKNSQCLIKN